VAVRKSLLLPVALLAVALGLAACGGGGSSSSGTTGGSGGVTPEAAWGKEVEGVMRQFENQQAQEIEQIHTSTSQARLEPLYRGYGAALAKLGKGLEATKAPPACEALRKKMGEDAAALAQLHTKLGHESGVDPEEFSALVAVQESRIHRYGHDLTEITYRPHC
jgi:ABC-type glycerol-3-phosphate transport system substrate-binding protein